MRVVAVALVAAGGIGCAGAPWPLGARECVPHFPYAGGWLGGDAAYSVALPGADEKAQRTLWLFGDSFVAGAEPEAADRKGSTFVHNSIGLSRCGRRGFEIDYHWGERDDGRPVAFFDSGSESPYWWLFDGFVHEGALYVGLLEVAEAEPDPQLALPFTLEGMLLARIDDPSAPPREWRPRTARLSASREAFPGAAMVVAGDHLLLFSFMAMRDGRQPRFLARLPLSALADFDGGDLSPQLETLVRDGEWRPGFLPDQARLLQPDNATEMSVERTVLDGREVWIAVYGAPIQTSGDGTGEVAPSSAVFARSASRPEGPWSQRTLLLEMPEATGPDRDPNVFCYAAKGHERFAQANELVVTYVCNLRTLPGEDPWPILSRLQGAMDLYRPRVVRVPAPEALAPADGRY